MSTRKLQQEFDKLQKKVAEGLQQFEDIYEKVTLTDNSNQKEKLEGDLRKEIKKLQRLRDQVKQWLGDSSNKLDKNVLQENRLSIENAMERFKEVEKVSKMKQFSNEGLEMQAKLGARGLDEAKKNEASKYIVDVLDELNRQNELLSAELNQHSHKKKLGNVQQIIDDLTEKIERNNIHIGKLELILRNLENDRLEPDRIDEIKDDLDYYVENNQASDFVEYNEFYDVLELDESLDIAPTYPQTPAEEPSATPSPKKPAAVASNGVRSGTPTPTATTVAAASPNPKVSVAVPPLLSPQPSTVRAPPPGLSTLSKSGSPAPATPVRTVADELKKRVLTQSAASVVGGSSSSTSSGVTSGISSSGHSGPTNSTSAAASGITGASANATTSASSTSARLAQLPTPLPILSNENKTFWHTAPRLSQLALSRLANPLPFQAISQMLETSLLNCPDSFDSERPRQYNPVNVHPSLVDYPQEPMFELNLGHLVRKFDIDTLFFCFYYSEGQDNLAKWNAARELTRRGWVFNKDTKQWFSKDLQNKNRSLLVVQRDGDKDVEGSYKYFDYQSSWLIRRKENFQLDATVRQTF